MSRFTSDDERSQRGVTRKAEIIAENDAMIRELTAGLMQSLGRPATSADLVLAGAIASAHVKAYRQRARGRDDSKELREILRLMRQFKPAEQHAENAA